MEIDKIRDPGRPTAMAYQEASMADLAVFFPSKEIGTNLSCFQGTFFGTLWTWRTVLRLSTQVNHSTRKNQIHTVAVDLPPIYQAVFAFRSHKWMLSQNDEHLKLSIFDWALWIQTHVETLAKWLSTSGRKGIVYGRLWVDQKPRGFF